MFEDIVRQIQVCVPFRLLKDKYLPLVLEHRINPEIGIDAQVIDTHSKSELSEMASIVREQGLTITLHSPFYDLVPGGMDNKMLSATRERLRETFDLIPVFEPVAIVCHTGYDKKRYHEVEEEWLETALETWTPLVRCLQGTQTTLMLENVYEKTPRLLVKLLTQLNSEKVGFCFDAGHMNVFSETSMQGWLEALGPLLKEVHLHDNEGTRDDHLAIGAGKIDFEYLFEHVEKNGLRPIMTLEAHKEKWMWQGIEALSQSTRFRRIMQT